MGDHAADVEDIPLVLRAALVCGTAAALIGWPLLLGSAGLFPDPGSSQQLYLAERAHGLTALIFGWALIGWTNRLARHYLEDILLDGSLDPEDAALRRKLRFYKRVRNNRHWFWYRKRLLAMSGAEYLTLERRQHIQYWISTTGFWLLLVGAHLPMLQGFTPWVFWLGLALAFGFPFLFGMEGLGKADRGRPTA